VIVALLFSTNPAWLAGFLGADLGAFLLYKAIRRDLQYWALGVGIPPCHGCAISHVARHVLRRTLHGAWRVARGAWRVLHLARSMVRVAGMLPSLVLRIIAKVMADFTGAQA
jgi:hypothetical protein